ncbi:hypothetical protein AEYBE204_09700 [Asticcacaulis sp. YBE204]|nr:hypothetical protein AEYBE204_09700 [Asticcacaulis sp. YBE204]
MSRYIVTLTFAAATDNSLFRRMCKDCAPPLDFKSTDERGG